MKFWFMRHAAAGPGTTDPSEERWRGLTRGGEETARAVGRKMLEDGEVPNFIIASEYGRASQTAQIVGEILGVPVDCLDELTPNMPVAPIVEAFLDDDDSRRVMIVGHTDNIDPLLERLTGEDDKLAKGEVRRYEIKRGDRESADLKWRLRPSDLGFVDEYETPLAGTEEAAEAGYT